MRWIKLDVNILDDSKIKIIRSHPDGDSVVVLWIGLLCLAMKSPTPGRLEISDGIPYTLDDLSQLLSIDKKTVEMGLHLFERYRMVELLPDGPISIINFDEHQNMKYIEHKRELTRIRVEKHRRKLLSCNALLTHDSVTVTPTNREEEVEEEVEKKKIIKYCPTSDEVRLSEALFSLITQRNPNHKKPNLQGWAKSIDLMIHIDKRPVPEIEEIITWCQGDSFWCDNILSTGKLREKYDQLLLKKRNGNGNQRGTGSAGIQAGRAKSDGAPYPIDATY